MHIKILVLFFKSVNFAQIWSYLSIKLSFISKILCLTNFPSWLSELHMCMITFSTTNRTYEYYKEFKNCIFSPWNSISKSDKGNSANITGNWGLWIDNWREEEKSLGFRYLGLRTVPHFCCSVRPQSEIARCLSIKSQ